MFEQQQVAIGEILDARREKIGPDRAWERIRDKDEVRIARGKKILVFAPDEGNREEILKIALGRSGSLRAPSIDTGTRMIIGFAEGIYENL